MKQIENSIAGRVNTRVRERKHGDGRRWIKHSSRWWWSELMVAIRQRVFGDYSAGSSCPVSLLPIAKERERKEE